MPLNGFWKLGYQLYELKLAISAAAVDVCNV